MVFFDPPKAVVPPGSDSARLPTAEHYFTCWAFQDGIRTLVACGSDVCWVSPRGHDHVCHYLIASSRLEDSPFFGEDVFFSGLAEILCFPKQVSAKHGSLLFLLFLALLAHSLFSKITMWKNNIILPNSFGILFAGCATLSVSYYTHWNGL